MNSHNAALLLNEGLTTIKGRFIYVTTNVEAIHHGDVEVVSKRDYTWFVTKELAGILQKYDLVLAEASGEIKIVQVTEVHADSEIDVDAQFKYNFAFQRVNTNALHTLHAKVKADEKALNSGRTQALREQVRNQYRTGIIYQHTDQGDDQ